MYIESNHVSNNNFSQNSGAHSIPNELRGITDLVLVVDTTLDDDLERVIIPDIPTVGPILLHNNYTVDYEHHSNLLFDNAHKFKNQLSPVTITLQFRLGLEDNGSSMIELLLKANDLRTLGNFKFKIYIFKIVSHQKPDPFKIPALEYFINLNPIGFRFDTDIMPSIPFISDEESGIKYHKNVNTHIPITISWLGKDLEELHLGQKVRLIGTDYLDLKFPKLVNHSFECYDLVTSHNWPVFFSKNVTIKCLTLRNFQTAYYQVFSSSFDKVTLIGFERSIKDRLLMEYLFSTKTLYFYGVPFQFGEWYALNPFVTAFPIKTEAIYYSMNPDWSSDFKMKIYYSIMRLRLKFNINICEVPFLPHHQMTFKSDDFHNTLHYGDYLAGEIKPAEFKYDE
ncbi:hypothetical protein DFJ63DRAFT_312952 [Scheffersomyces coipomensis]|uniref:uncharacterized protein n=1 Tax=Scheffersomyces coipomensis TaxID=1788519 RepID=UPI00315D6456